MFRNANLALLLGLFLSGSLLHGEEAPDFSSGMLDRDALIARAADVTPERFPDADEVQVGTIQRIRYEPDGTYVQWHESYTKILTENARRSYRTLSSWFTIPYQRGPEDCRIPLVEIIKPDGEAVKIDVEGQSSVMIDPSSMSKNIYNPNDKIIKVNISGLEVGDVLHFVMYDRIVQPRMAGSWNDWFSLESTRPIMESVVEIDAPADMPLRSIALLDPVGETVTRSTREEGGRIHYRWVAQDVPRMFAEPNMPTLYTVVQRLLVSTNPNWEHVSRWYWDLSEPHLDTTPDIRAKVNELVNGATAADQKIEALFNFVSREIRYMGITAETVSPGYEPHDVADTFNARHGVCRDKAALLVAMLREAGLDAFPALINNGPKKDPEVPQPYFNHAIVAVRLDGGFRLMDPTDETTRELLPSYLDDCSFLVATPEGETLMTSGIEPSDVNLLRIETRGSVDAEGRLGATTRLVFNGINDNAYRGYFARIKPEERRRFFESVAKRVVPRARVTDVEILPLDMMDTSTSLTVRVSFEADDVLVRGNALAMLPLPVMGTRLGMVNFVIGKTGLASRRYPLKTGYACGVQESLELTLPESCGEAEIIPDFTPVAEDAIRWHAAIEQKDRRVTYEADFRLEVAEFSPDEYGLLKETLKAIERANRQMPGFRYAGQDDDFAGSSDVLIESVDVDIAWLGEGSWRETRSVRKRILTYAGKKSDSELKISFNPAWSDVELLEAKVTSADGSVSEISDKEVNIMDASWVGAAPRYPPSRTLVASFPAVEEGSVIEYTVQHIRRDRPFLSLRESFAGFDALLHKSVDVVMPPGQALFSFNRNPAGIDEDIDLLDDGSVRRSWRSERMPGAKQEDRHPPAWDLFPTVFLSSGNWASYVQWLNEGLDHALSTSGDAAQKAVELVQGIEDPRERIRVLRDFVALRIRPVAGPGLSDLPRSALSFADTTLRDGYGHGADRTVLLFAMLKAVGFSPEFVAVSAIPDLPRLKAPFMEAASPAVFDTLLLRLKPEALAIPEDRYIYLGDSSQYGAVGVSRHEGLWALRIPNGGFVIVNPERPGTAEMEIQMQVEADGNTRMEHITRIHGAEYEDQKRWYEELTPELRRRHYQELVAGISQAARAEGELETDFDGYPGIVKFAVNIDKFAIRDGAFLYFDLPHGLSRALYLTGDARVHPLYIGQHRESRVDLSIAYPGEFDSVILPRAINLAGLAGADIRLDVSDAGISKDGLGLLHATAHISQRPNVVPAESYSGLLDWGASLSHRRASAVVLRHREAAKAAGAPLPVSAEAD